MTTPDGGQRWPAEKLTTLRLGQPLAVEVPASGRGRRAFVTISPVTTPADQLDGFDYDLGAVLIQDATAHDEAELITMLQAWSLRPDQFLYPWQTDDPT